MTMDICLTVLIGLPGSGKTTFARALKTQYKFYKERRFNFIHVCYDELISLIDSRNFHGDQKKWKDLRMTILDKIDLLLSSLKNNIQACPEYFMTQLEIDFRESVIVIIVDDNMFLRSMRYELFKKAKQYGLSYCQVYLKSTVEYSVERNISRNSENIVPLEVITRMDKKIEPPKTENKWEKYSLVIDVMCKSNELYTRYFSLLSESLKNPYCVNSELALMERERSIITCMTNVLHQSDIVLRHIIGTKIQSYMHNASNSESNSNFKKYLLSLSSKKSKILCDIKSGVIQIPEHILREILVKEKTNKEKLTSFLEELFKNNV